MALSLMARSAFNHSMNYRSAVIFGRFALVADEAAKRASMEALMDKLAIGRQAEVRPGSDKEYAATTVLRIGLTAACKVRTGGPNDDEEDMAWPVWAGVLPFTRMRVAPVPNEECRVTPPAYVLAWQSA
jgi:nitroimidazol reductase NimA-like FMN-containing flavoprotein (pyridoxamine 5'-phosphate oxidase superfamily)